MVATKRRVRGAPAALAVPLGRLPRLRKPVSTIAANKGKLPNGGETDFVFETEEGFLESWKFQIAEVIQALASIADRVNSNHRVVFERDEKTGKYLSYIYTKTTE